MSEQNCREVKKLETVSELPENVFFREYIGWPVERCLDEFEKRTGNPAPGKIFTIGEKVFIPCWEVK